MQSWDLQKKIQVTQTRIIEWYNHFEGKCYVSFSGGKDSTVLADLAARVCKMLNHKLVLWFCDTGLEFPEVRQHVKTFGDWLTNKYDIEVETIMDYPKKRRTGKRILFKDIVLGKGYPIISKEVAETINTARNAIIKNKPDSYAMKKLNGEKIDPHTGLKSGYNMEKWKFLLNAPFKISNYCCKAMKKQPAHYFEVDSGLVQISGTMACESSVRRTQWLERGCNSFDSKRPISKPMSFWMEQDVLQYIKDFDIPIAKVYGDVVQNENGDYCTSGYSRTGCVFCAFGAHLDKEPTKFQQLKCSHPKLWEYCMKPVEEGGLGMKKVLEYINVKVE